MEISKYLFMNSFISRLRNAKIKYYKPWLKRIKERRRYLNEYKEFKISQLNKVATFFSDNKKNYKNITLNELRDAKSSETIVLLGSAPSINDITQKQWEQIKTCDSFGINFWYLNDFVPTYYFMEPPKDQNILELHKRMLSQKGNSYEDVIYFLFDWFTKVGWHPMYSDEIFPKGIKLIKFPHPIRKKLHKSIPFDPKYFVDISRDMGDKIINYRSSISIILHLAYQMRYKNIFLTGFDLNSNEYFYDNNPLMKNRIDLNQKRKQKFHSTTDYGDCHGIDNYVIAFNEYVLKPKKINLYVSSKQSLLYPKVPYKSLDSTQN